MGRPKRGEQFSCDEVGIAHVVQRCVRRAFLAGIDQATGKDYSFRREWIRRRMELLASVFGLDLLSYAVMSNHLHLILRTRPDVVETWSDEEVALRWLRLFPGKRLEEHLGEPTDADLEQVLNTPGRVALLRKRLSDVSWFMKSLSEPIARLANKQDECTGRFWEGRFKAQKIVDEAGLLACAMYVDLNPVRAAMAESPESSQFTSAYDRIRATHGEQQIAAADEAVVPEAAKPQEQVDLERRLSEAKQAGRDTATKRLSRQLERLLDKLRQQRAEQLRRLEADAWLAPLELNERGRPSPKASRDGVRASNKGFLSMSLTDYLNLLDWTGRQRQADKRGNIPSHLAPIMDRLGIAPGMWADLVWNFNRYFGRSRAAGSPDGLKAEAQQSHRYWIPGQRTVAGCFA